MTAVFLFNRVKRLRFQNLGKPRTAGLCGRAAGACDCGPLSCAKIERPSPLENLPVKFGFSPRTVPANIAKKLPAQRCSKPHFIAFFSLSHKRPTFAFTGKNGYTPGSRRKIAHSGLHAETGAFPLSATVWPVLPAKFLLLRHAFIYIHFPVLCEPPLSADEKKSAKLPPQLYLKQFFNFSHKRPTFAFTSESGYTRHLSP